MPSFKAVEPEAFDVVFESGHTFRDALVREGTIGEAYWGSMGDWPMFTLIASDGSRSALTRDGDARRYAPGLRVQVTSDADGRVVRVAIERSGRRVSGIAVGPGGAGLKNLGGPGTVVHWAVFESDDDRARAIAHAALHQGSARRWDEPGRPSDEKLLRIVGGEEQDVRAAIASCAGAYDGHEVIVAQGAPSTFGPAGET